MAASRGAAPAITPDSATNPPSLLPSPPFTQHGRSGHCHQPGLRNATGPCYHPPVYATPPATAPLSPPPRHRPHPARRKAAPPNGNAAFPGRKAGRQRAPTGYARDARGFLPPPAATRGTSREPGPWWCRRPGPRPRSCRRRWRPYGRRSRPGSPSCARR